MKSAKRSLLGLVLLLALAFAWLGGKSDGGLHRVVTRYQQNVGRELFVREWIAGDPRSFAGDGLGPVFNARSCASCHRQGGIGGSGAIHNNAVVVSALAPFAVQMLRDAGQAGPRQPSRAKLATIHPALKSSNSFPLHRFGPAKEFELWKMAWDLNDLAAAKSADFAMGDLDIRSIVRPPNQKMIVVDGSQVLLVRSERRTPPLFGSGLIDQIPESTLKAVAAEQARTAEDSRNLNHLHFLVSPRHGDALPVKGRAAFLKDGRVGRFGWKNQTATLREFTMQACSSEIGLEVPGFPRAKPPWDQNYQAPGLDMSAEQCDQLVDFVASIPRPVVRVPETPRHAAEIAAGEKLFAALGCAVCHRPNLGSVEGIFSDLLLHDMGAGLSDSGSYGAIQPEPLLTDDSDSLPQTQQKSKFGASAREWRTPPLWGLRDSAPYMHDGRAATIAEAVALHGGEGRAASLSYSRLKPPEREKIELFLRSLTAPPAPN